MHHRDRTRLPDGDVRGLRQGQLPGQPPALYPQPNTADVRELLRGQDMIWVADGSLASLLAVRQVPTWRLVPETADTPASC